MNSNIKAENIYHMLQYIFDFFEEKPRLEQETKLENIKEVIAYILINLVEKQVKRGLNRNYNYVFENTNSIKGKISISQTIKNFSNGNYLINCEIDEFNINTYENKIIKASLLILLKNKKGIKDKFINKIIVLLEYLSLVENIEAENIDWNRISNKDYFYREIINFCALFLKKNNAFYKGKNKDGHMTNWNDLLNVIFERFVYSYYYKKFNNSSVDVNRREIKWQFKDIDNHIPKMLPDVFIEGEDKIFVIDAKYYENEYSTKEGGKYRFEHLYQIFSYVQNTYLEKKKDIIGMLLYAKSNTSESGETKAKESELFGDDYKIKEQNCLISLKNIDLTNEFNYIKNELNEIKKKYFDESPKI